MKRYRHEAHSLAFILSFGCLVLGIGCIGWALVSIRAQSTRSADAYVSTSSSPTGSVAKPAHKSPEFRLNPVVYPRHPSEGDEFGSLSIPALRQTLPIIEGTAENDLRKGVGHYIHSVLPGEADNCVLSGHRDTVFTRLGKLKIGDRLTVRTSAGAFTYKIRRIRIVDKDDRTVIVPTDHGVLTVSTCYPFHFIGSAPRRYILSADLVKSD